MQNVQTIMLDILRHTKCVKGYIVFIFPSVRPYECQHLRQSAWKVFLLRIFLKAYTLGCWCLVSVTTRWLQNSWHHFADAADPRSRSRTYKIVWCLRQSFMWSSYLLLITLQSLIKNVSYLVWGYLGGFSSILHLWTPGSCPRVGLEVKI